MLILLPFFNEELNLTLQLIHHKIKNGFNIIKEYSQIPYVNCYPNMLNQVFLNILMNSIYSIDNTLKLLGFSEKKDYVIYNSMKYPITYVQGPPGTGKTQTILNVCFFNMVIFFSHVYLQWYILIICLSYLLKLFI